MKQEKVFLKIAGTDFTILTEESAEYTRKLASQINDDLQDLLIGNSSLTNLQGLVLLCLDYADSKVKAENRLDHLKREIKDYLEDASMAKAKADSFEIELSKTKNELEAVKLEKQKLLAEIKKLRGDSNQ